MISLVQPLTMWDGHYPVFFCHHQSKWLGVSVRFIQQISGMTHLHPSRRLQYCDDKGPGDRGLKLIHDSSLGRVIPNSRLSLRTVDEELVILNRLFDQQVDLPELRRECVRG
jgi:hypothetical protein